MGALALAQPNLIDRIIGYMAPRAGVQRLHARTVLSSLEKRSFEGAAKTKRLSGWKTSNSSANSDNQVGLHTLRARSRHLIKNNGYAASVPQTIAADVVGAGIFPNVVVRKGAGVGAKAAAGAVDELLTDWADTTDCDADGVCDLYGLQDLIMQTVVGSGECLVRRRIRRTSDGFPVPLQIQVLEPDHLDHGRSAELTGGGRIIQGVQFNAFGQREGYWLFDRHPGDAMFFAGASSQSKFVPASEILHLFNVRRAGQVRGTPWLAPVIIRLNDLSDYEDAQAMRQKIAACFAGFIRDANLDQGATGLTGTEGKDVNDLPEDIGPGLLERLPPGKDITFSNPPSVDGYESFLRGNLRGSAAGVGMSYEGFTGDLSNVNYSSYRGGHLKYQRVVDVWRSKVMIRQFCDPVADWLYEILAVMGVQTEGTKLGWTPPRREMIDPTKEVPAMTKAVRSGFKTLSEVIRESGKDPAEHFEEMSSDYETLDQHKLVLETDVRQDAKNTSAAQGPAKPPSKNSKVGEAADQEDAQDEA